jgi:hypothetical protein
MNTVEYSFRADKLYLTGIDYYIFAMRKILCHPENYRFAALQAVSPGGKVRCYLPKPLESPRDGFPPCPNPDRFIIQINKFFHGTFLPRSGLI